MDIYYNYSELLEKKQYDLLIDVLKDNYEHTKDIQYVIKIANVYNAKDDYKNALKELLKAHKASPSVLLAKNIALIYFNLGKYKKAIKYFDNVIEYENITSENLYNLGCSYHYNGNLIEAYKYYLNALKLDPDNLHARNNLGCLLYETNNYEDAINTFKDSLDIDKDNPEAYYYLGILYRIYVKDYELSKLYLKRAIWLDDVHFESYQELLKTLEIMNENNEIEELKKTVSEIFPGRKLS